MRLNKVWGYNLLVRIFLFILLFPISASTSVLNDVLINGFASTGFSRSDSSIVYGEGIKNKNNFVTGTKAGVSISNQFSNEIDFYLGITADAQINEKMEAEVDTVQVRWTLNSKNNIRFGKIRMPTWLFSEFLLISALYPWVRPPEVVYNSQPLRTFTGLSYTKRFEVNNWSINSDLFYGTSTTNRLFFGSQTTADIDSIYGLTVRTNYNDFQFNLSHVRSNAIVNVYTTVDSGVSTSAGNVQTQIRTPVNLGRIQTYIAGLKYDGPRLYFASEFVVIKSSNSTQLTSNHAGYYTLGTYFNSKNFLAHTTFTKTYKAENNVAAFAGTQESIQFGLNYYHSPNLVFKSDWQRVNPAGNGKGEFQTNPGTDPVNIWAVSVATAF